MIKNERINEESNDWRLRFGVRLSSPRPRRVAAGLLLIKVPWEKKFPIKRSFIPSMKGGGKIGGERVHKHCELFPLKSVEK